MIALLALACGLAAGSEIRVAVLQLLRPSQLTLHAGQIAIGAERISARDGVIVSADGNRVRSRGYSGEALSSTGPQVTIETGGMRRAYRGSVEIRARGGVLLPIVTIELEQAVAAVVAAEMPGAQKEALRAQAIAARSYYLAGDRHAFGFCDTTHCQFLTAPDASSSAAAKDTERLVLTHAGRVARAMYFRSCSGTTLSAADAGLSSEPYSYFSAICETCRRKPYQWEARLPQAQAERLLREGPSETLRVQLARQFGWNTIASNTYTAFTEGGTVILRGTGHGHGVGLCQRGARGMAESGAGYAAILQHYFQATELSRK
ncbi:MAG: hypothetical protein HYZ37_05320 [Candidatus Solibacter usitatus]|nr:hypothetical protein [Candidatus Solibacter usitatus]